MSGIRRVCDVCLGRPGARVRGLAPRAGTERIVDATYRVTVGIYAGSWHVCDEHLPRLVDTVVSTLDGMTMYVNRITTCGAKLVAIIRRRV